MTTRCTKVGDVISTLDLFGAPVMLLINDDKEHKTVLGAFVTVLTLGAAIYLTSSTILDFANFTNPSVSSSTEYDLNKINFNYSNFYFGISFYDPNLTDVGEQKGVIKSNNWTTVKYINQLNITCTTCGDNNKQIMMNLCAKEQFLDKQLNSMSKIKSDSVIAVFKNYSFCFPEQINGTIEDLSKSNSTFDSGSDTTLTIFIPISKISMEDMGILRNDAVPDQSTSPTKPEQVVEPDESNPPPKPVSPVEPPTTQPSNSKPSESPPESQPHPSSEQPDEPDSSSVEPPYNPCIETNSCPCEYWHICTNSDSESSSNDPTTNNTNSQDISKNDSNPDSFPTATESDNSSQPEPSNGNRILISEQMRSRNLQTFKNDIQTIKVNKEMSDILNQFKFPKMLIINRDFKLNPGSLDPENFLKYIYGLEVLDYRDSLSGNPIVYDIYVQKKKIVVEKPIIFSLNKTTIEMITIQRIERNAFDSLQNNGAYFSFKLLSDVEVINVKYVTISNVLGVFGSFFTTFSLVGRILASIFNKIFLQTAIINKVFKFISNDPKEFEKVEVDLKKMLSNKRFQKQQQIELENLNKAENKRKNQRLSEQYLEENKASEENKLQSNDFKVINDTLTQNDHPIIVHDVILETSKEVHSQEQIMKMKHTFDSNLYKNVPLYELERQSLTNKVREIEEIQQDMMDNQKLTTADLYEINKIKKIKRMRHPLSPCTMFFVMFGFSRCFNKERTTLWEATWKITMDNIQIDNLVRKLLDLEQIKKLLLTPKQLMMFKYYMKNINYKNFQSSNEFLKSCFKESLSLKKEELEKDEKGMFKGQTNLLLYENFKNTFNF